MMSLASGSLRCLTCLSLTSLAQKWVFKILCHEVAEFETQIAQKL